MFRLSVLCEAYGLAADGSEDYDDASGNGIANILYLAFNLGDPNGTEIIYSDAGAGAMGLPVFEATGVTDTWTVTYVRLKDTLEVMHQARRIKRV